jgi:gamma-glutamyl-gamma-aminobutyrate hydrolase PuuD
MKKTLFVPDYLSYATPWWPLFGRANTEEDADVILFTGGADIAPAFYGERPGRFTYTSPARDIREKALFERALARGQKFLGICRGAQLLCAMAGGKLAQHIDNHAGGFSTYHGMTTVDGSIYPVNSVHHQMMIPTKDDELIGWSSQKLSDEYLDGNNLPIKGIEVEPEIVYFPHIQGLGIQCHPEAIPMQSATMKYFHNLVSERLL